MHFQGCKASRYPQRVGAANLSIFSYRLSHAAKIKVQEAPLVNESAMSLDYAIAEPVHAIQTHRFINRVKLVK